MGKSCFLLFSHKLTPEQAGDLKENWQVENIIPLPARLQFLWSNIPPDLSELNGYLEPIKHWLKQNARPGDLALIQGDYGATYLMVGYALSLKLTPIYATTERIVKETLRGQETIVQRVFKHKGFRQYGR